MGDSPPLPSPPDGRARVCLLCTCGLPGAGKSTLARRIAARAVAAGDVARADIVSFDDVEREVRLETARARGETRDAARGFDAQAWRDSRKLALARVDALLASDDDADACPTRRRLVIADDNFYYASMRYQAHQLARRARAAHVQLHVNVPVELARARNERRAADEIVPSVAFDRMANAFEPPDPSKRTFEDPTVRTDDDASNTRVRSDDDVNHDVNHDDVNDDAYAWGLVWDAWGAPPRLPITEEEREALTTAGRDANATSAVHALDLRSRRALGDAMRRVSSGGPGGRRADASVALNAARKEMLDAVRERSKGKNGSGWSEEGADEFEALDLASFVMAREEAFAELCEAFGGDGGAGGP